MKVEKREGSNEKSSMELPDDHGKAVEWVYSRYKKLVAERKWSAERMRDVFTDAKAAGYTTEDVRLALKLSRMTVEQRFDWADRIKRQAKAYGFKVDEVPDHGAKDEKLETFLKRAADVTAEKTTVREAMKELSEAAKVYSDGKDSTKQIRMEYIKLLAKLSEVDDAESESPAGDWFDGLDAIGTFLRLW